MRGSTGELPHDALDALARVPIDDALDALGHVQRRKLLYALLEHNPQDASPAVLDGSNDRIDALERHVAMNHVHLPKLEGYGFVDWERDEREVVKGPNFEAIEPLLVLLSEHEDELPDDWL